jgi:hypothetical protein
MSSFSSLKALCPHAVMLHVRGFTIGLKGMGTHFIPQDSPSTCQFFPLATIWDILAFLAKTVKCIWNWEWGTIHNFLHQHHGEKAPLSVSLTPHWVSSGEMRDMK